MLTVYQYGDIRRASRDGMSVRDIARTFHHSRRKVRQILAEGQPRPYTRTQPTRAPMLGAFHTVIDGILVAGCLEGGCHFLEGNLRARKRTDRIREILEEIGVGGERLLMVNLSAAMAPTFVERVHEIVETVRALGPSPLKSPPQRESAGQP